MTFVALAVILLAAEVAWLWWHKPPTLQTRIDLYGLDLARLDLSKFKPLDTVLVKFQALPPDAVMGTDDPMPLDVYEYIQKESEPAVREQRMRHARTLRAELGDWKAAFTMLQMEDTPA